MTGVAVKVTDVPEQIAPAGLAAIVTLTGRFGLTVMPIVFDVAGLPVGHTAFDVRVTVMISPFERVLVVYVGFVSPGMLTPPFFHW